MTNWKSGSLLLACALGLSACGDDGGNNRMDSGMDSAVEDASDSSTPVDASDSAVGNPALIRLAALPLNFPPVAGNAQAFDICLQPAGSPSHILATVNETLTGKRSLPVGAISAHSFPAAQLEMVCGFPANTGCTVKVFKAEDVTFMNTLGTPICVPGNAAVPVATIELAANTFQGAQGYTVALVGDAAEPSGARAPHLEIFPDVLVAPSTTQAHVRVVNLDPSATFPAWETCYDRNLGGGQATLLGDTASVSYQLNPSNMRSAYVNVDPLAPMDVPADGGGNMTVPVLFTVHIPNALGLTHCDAFPDLPPDPEPEPDGIPVTMWPPSSPLVPPQVDFTMVYAGYEAGATMGGGTPVQALQANTVVTVFIYRMRTGPNPEDTVALAIPMLDRVPPAP